MSESKLLKAAQAIAGRAVGVNPPITGAIDPSILELIDRIAEILLEVLDRCLEARRRPDEAIEAMRHPTRFQQWLFRNLVRRRVPRQFQNQYVRLADEAMLYAQRSSQQELRELIDESADPNHVLV